EIQEVLCSSSRLSSSPGAKMALLPHLFLHSFLLGLGIRVSLTFNIDLTNPNVYDGERDHFFGYKVLQFTSGESKG
ncbi:hypothetical protein D4764_06G0013220, partial [Takifugu flavidus]